MKPVLVFDWNGTLLDDTYALLETSNVILERFGHPRIGIEALREHCDVPLSLLYRRLGMSQEEVEAVDRDGSALFHDTYEALADKADLREGARKLLEFARGESARAIIVSNHIVAPLRTQLKRLGIQDCINDVLAFESRATQYKSMGKGERLRLYMRKHNVKPSSTFIIGDMPIEVEIARSLGLTSISITGGFVSDARLHAAHPDYTVNSHEELLPILRKHGFFLEG